MYIWYLFIYCFNYYNLYSNLLLQELSKNLFLLLLFSLPCILVSKNFNGIFNNRIKKLIVFLIEFQKKWFTIIIITIGFLEYLLFFKYKSYYNILPNFLKYSFWSISISIMIFECTLSFLSIFLSYLYFIEDYENVKYNFDDEFIEKKLCYCIESFEMTEKCTYFMGILNKYYSPKIPNVLVISKEKKFVKSYYDLTIQCTFNKKY